MEHFNALRGQKFYMVNSFHHYLQLFRYEIRIDVIVFILYKILFFKRSLLNLFPLKHSSQQSGA